MSDLIEIKLNEGELEGTSASFAAWLVKVGDKVTQGQPVAELETDKVVMEVCAPADGYIENLSANIGDSIVVDQVLATISQTATVTSQEPDEAEVVKTIEPKAVFSESSVTQQPLNKSAKELLSPAVRRLIKENNLSIEQINGSGKGGRITRDDVKAYLASGASTTSKPELSIPASTSITERTSRELVGNKIPHSPMRKSIASHMVESLLHTSPHVTSVFEMDMSAVIKHRKQHKAEFEKQGVNLSFTAYFLAAMCQGIKAVPQVNARFHEDALELFEDVNIGVGTALGDKGLVVPVIEQVQQMSLFEIAHNLQLQTVKARDGKLTTKDMQNGSITISNHGVSGSLFATPIIINQPQVAILGVGKLEKRVVVKTIDDEDYMVIKPMCYVSLSIDHRALDAHQTNQFLSVFVDTIEAWK
ncbi:MAG: 2-oxo acid dehydrogenase subunit E2 [Gammaproteobacteria bacterium]|nr:2-oxo acid dehydrogenase subunit E2 [Gammaproteobacteria bacterium]